MTASRAATTPQGEAATSRPINLTIQPTRAEFIREGCRLRMGARTVTVASITYSSDEDNDYLVAHFEEPGAAPRIFNLDRFGGALIDVIVSCDLLPATDQQGATT